MLYSKSLAEKLWKEADCKLERFRYWAAEGDLYVEGAQEVQRETAV